MVSSLFSRRPRIQPLPKICRAAPHHSCYDPPLDWPDPLKIQVYYWQPPDPPNPDFTWLARDEIYRDSDYFWTIDTPTTARGDLTGSFEYGPVAKQGTLILSTTGHAGVPPDWEDIVDLEVPPFPFFYTLTAEGEGGEDSFFTVQLWT